MAARRFGDCVRGLFHFCMLLGFVSLSISEYQGDGGQRNVRVQSMQPRIGGNGNQLMGGGGSSQGTRSRLGDDPACIDYVRKFCRNQNPSTMNNLSVLDCLQNNVPKEEELSSDCQHSIWMAKKFMSDDMRFDGAAGAVCQNDLQKLQECNNLGPGRGFKIPCLIDNIDNITSAACKDFLGKMEAIVFSDYRLVYRFVESCRNDIDSFRCGRLEDDEDEKSIHNQGETIACLQGNLTKLQPQCKQQILRISELQGEDYHKDRQLFFACQDDREKFCPNVQSGGGRVYQCLTTFKFDPRMSLNCRSKLTVRQQMQRVDYKVNRGFTAACKAHIVNEKCVERLQQSQAINMHENRLSVILLCLENATKAGRKLDPECTTELVNIRKSLMSDYRISPEIVTSCATEIQDFCNKGLERDGKTIHCLMSATRKQLQEARKPNDQRRSVSQNCQRALGFLMKEVDVRENFQIDPVLQTACGSIVRMKCSNMQAGQGKVIDCLMGLIDRKDIMTDECEARLMEIQYFVSRDFSLSPGFYRACKSAMTDFCQTDPVKLVNEESETKSSVLLCLWRIRDKNQNTKTCSDAVKQVMIDRANSVDLEPAVEAACMNDLSSICSSKTGKNEEMDCLEDNIKDLEADCAKVVKQYIEEEDELPELHEIFMKACEPVLKDKCKDALGSGKDANGDSLMNCLIKNKYDPDMTQKCRAGIEHHQLITLKDYSLSFEFKKACANEVATHCPSGKTKFEVVNCLSEVLRNDTLLETSPPRLEVECRKQLKFELFQRSSGVKFDPELAENCDADLREKCSDVPKGKANLISCLKRNQQGLRPECRKFLFKRERIEALDPTTDFALMTKCKSMIKKYCENELTQPGALFACLRKNKDEDQFDQECARVIVLRQRVRALDVRLNPNLLRDCKPDIKKYCASEYQNTQTAVADVEGKVLGCLRATFAKQRGAKLLTDICSEHIKDMIKESQLDYVQDVALAKSCKKEIKDNCSLALMMDKRDPDRGAVVECLREVMMKTLIKSKSDAQKPCWKEVIRVLGEDKVDIHINPILYKACSNDLLHVCKDVARGEGRQMSCLVDALNDKKVDLSNGCRKILSDHVNLWNKAMEAAAPESLSDMALSVSASPARNYLMTVLFAIIAVIFVGGLFCGRVTKRIARQVKDR